ncbi:FAD-dependent oxidoreductase [Chloroflexota bacterium]
MELFKPGRIGKLKLKNRIIMAPMNMVGLTEPDGRISEQAIDYFAARAKGGVGLITTGWVSVDLVVSNDLYAGVWSVRPRIDYQVYVSRWSILADRVHDYGAKLSIQLTAGFGRVYPFLGLSFEPVAPSAQPCLHDPTVIAREITIEEIEKLVRSFGVAAKFAKTAGIDAIELHAHGGLLMDQFQSALWNKRTDKYGGDLERRLRFPLEVIASIKEAAGADYPVIYMYGLNHYIEGGREVEESQEMARRLEQAGVDAIHADAGGHGSQIHKAYQPPGFMVDMAEAAKKAVNIPVIAVGRLGDPEVAERVLREGKADFIALGRPLLADPEWPNKVREGRLDDIRPCIECNDGCFGRRIVGKYLSCAVNPASGMERDLALQPAESQKSVLVIGGGPGGMEAAMVAALRGHHVTLWEASHQLGGGLIPASVPDFKADIRWLIRYLSTQINKLGVDIRLGTVATPEMVQEMAPEVVIIATGASPIIPEIPGVNKSIAAIASDILLGKKEAGVNVVVVGGGLVGCETAVFLAGKGKRVTLVEMLGGLALHVTPQSRPRLLQMLAQSKVEVLTNTTVSQITDDSVIASGKSGEKRELKADTVVLAVGFKPREELEQALMGKVAELRAIGDCVEPRKIIDAMWEGFRFARLI